MSVKKADKIVYHERYPDGSGVEFEVTYENKEYTHDSGVIGVIEIKHIDEVEFPITKLDWLIECLQSIKHNKEITND